MTTPPHTLAAECLGWLIAVLYLVVLCCVLLLLRVPGLVLRAIGTTLANAGSWAQERTNGAVHWIDARMP